METLLLVLLIVLLWETSGFFRLIVSLLGLALYLAFLHLLLPSTVFWLAIAILAVPAAWPLVERRREREEAARRWQRMLRHPSWSCHVCSARIDPRLERCPSCGHALAGTVRQRMAAARADLVRVRPTVGRERGEVRFGRCGAEVLRVSRS